MTWTGITQEDELGFGNTQIGSLLTIHDPDNAEVEGGAAGDVNDKPVQPWPYTSAVIHVSALPAYTLPVSDKVRIITSNDKVKWRTLLEMTFDAFITQEIVFEEIKYRFVRIEIDAAAVGKYLATAWFAQ